MAYSDKVIDHCSILAEDSLKSAIADYKQKNNLI